MSGDVLGALAAAAALLAVAAGAGAVFIRTLFALNVFLFAASAAASLAALALGAGGVALALIVIGGGLSFLMSAGAVLLTTRAAKASRPGARLIPLALGAMAALALLWAAPELALTQSSEPPARPEALLLALIVLAGAMSAYGLLGFGERAAFAPRSEDEEG